MQAVRCPVCGGSGEFTHHRDGNSTTVSLPEQCHGCHGRGWVEVGAIPCPVPYPPTYVPTVYPFYPPYYPSYPITWW